MLTQPSAPAAAAKIIVLDDDPTGSQTVHSCLLLLQWDVDSLVRGLEDESPIFFVLTNTRSLPPAAAAAVTREVCRNLRKAIAQTGTANYLLVSRSDSTLRGHYPLETDTIAEELGPFDATFLVPAFFEGGRITLDSTHYIEQEGIRTAVHDTEFAQDASFGFCSSHLPTYVEEKTAGRIKASQVKALSLQTIRAEPQDLMAQLLALEGDRVVAVDAEQPQDLEPLAEALRRAAAQGKRFLFRSAASLLTSLAQLPLQPVPMAQMSKLRRSQAPGVIVVGSHVGKTTAQLQHLLAQPNVVGMELDIQRLAALLHQRSAVSQKQQRQQWLQQLQHQLHQHHKAGQTPVLYTSRQVVSPPQGETAHRLSCCISAFWIDLIQGLPPSLSFLISKGGITSNDVLSQALGLKQVRLAGQLIPGVCIVQTSPEHRQFPLLPVVMFPGNVGSKEDLTLAYRRLSDTA